MKAIMISIKPKWVAKILNGDKTIEVRKNKALASAIQKLIDKQGYADIYVYCSKDGDNHLHKLYDHSTDETLGYSTFYYQVNNVGKWGIEPVPLNGKVVFKFRCYKVEEIEIGTKKNTEQKDYSTFYSSIDEMKLLKTSCLDAYEMLKYAGYCDDFLRAYKYKVYAIHISDLEIFDKPKEISEFKPYTCNQCDFQLCSYCNMRPLTKAPQNFCYVKVE